VTQTQPASKREINRRYVPLANSDSLRERSAIGSRRFRREPPVGGQRHGRTSDAVRLFLLPLLFLYGAAVVIVLKFRLSRRQVDGLHADALERVDRFIEQYPLHPYPILAKSLELAHLLRELPEHALAADRILELAIGDGTLSRHVFPMESRVVGADIAPVSLRFAARMPHVASAIVCDCLDPPFADGSFDLLVANNFLHHVTAKEDTLDRWGRIASVLVFTESTRYWASGWARPFILRHLGFAEAGRKVELEIEVSHYQDLVTLDELDRIAGRGREIRSRDTCFSERTFFIASIFSSLLRCTGPPTPTIVKRLLLGPLRRISLPLTRSVARVLIRYDATLPRDRDAYVLYVLRAEAWTSSDGSLVCPICGGAVVAFSCSSCGKEFDELDGMRFVLPPALAHIQESYDVAVANMQSAEQL
jgi:hypothetical protein